MSCHRYTLALAVMLLAGLAACGSTSSRGSGGIAKVDNLKSWVERVQAESERSKERVRTAVDSLDAVIAANYEDEVVVAYRKFRESINHSQRQALNLHATLKSMKRSAEPVFVQWNNDLQGFSSIQMRQRSRERLSDARRRYEAVVDAAEPALSIYEEINRTLGDYALYLNHDLNQSSLAGIGEDIRTLKSLATQLDSQFDDCATAAQNYLHATDQSAAPGGAAPVEDRSGMDDVDLPTLPDRER